MKRVVIPIIIVLMLSTLACSFTVNLPNVKVTTGPTETLNLNESAPAGDQPAHVTLQMGAGTFDLAGGAKNLVEGSIRYNVPDWKPVVTRNSNGLTVKQEATGQVNVPGKDLINEWNLKLGDNQPIDLTVQAGAYQGKMDLSGLKLTNLSITDGASDNEVHFDSANPTEMDELSYKTGASQVKLYGLANANFKTMSFTSGAGNYELDFSGKLQRDATVDIKSGVSQVTIIIPEGMNAKVKNQAGISGIDTSGNWTTNGNIYTVEGEGPTLTINVDMGIGSLKLEQK
jgi:hypothetical protein